MDVIIGNMFRVVSTIPTRPSLGLLMGTAGPPAGGAHPVLLRAQQLPGPGAAPARKSHYCH